MKIESELIEGCEFCRSETKFKSDETDISIIKTQDEGYSLWFSNDEEHFREFIFINYCPICGRKLVE